MVNHVAKIRYTHLGIDLIRSPTPARHPLRLAPGKRLFLRFLIRFADQFQKCLLRRAKGAVAQSDDAGVD
jgi:hypothetical protein